MLVLIHLGDASHVTLPAEVVRRLFILVLIFTCALKLYGVDDLISSFSG